MDSEIEEREVGGLRCGEVLAMLSDFVEGDLSEDVVTRVTLHLGGCPNCGRFGPSFARMVASMKEQSQPEPIDDALMARLCAPFE